MFSATHGVGITLCVSVLVSVVSAGAPGDEDSFCTNEFPSSAIPPNSKILLDSYNYINLLPPQDNAVWQEVDNDNNNEAGRGTEWSQNSNIPCRQAVTVCGFEVGPQDNWLITQYISTVVNDTRLAQVSVTVEYELVGCTSLECQRTFVVNIYKTSTEDDSIAADTSNYLFVTRIATDDDTGLTRQNRTVDVNLNGNADGLYLAIRDETTCIVITRMLVFYSVCPGGAVDFVMRPETLAPIVMRNPIPLKVNAECVAGASPENGEGAILNCNQGGIWTVIPGAGCQCDPGFVAAENGTSCTPAGCPIGEYLSVANAECRVCPGNSEGTVSGLTVCPCFDGYYRAEGEEDIACTRPPSAPRNLMVVSTTSTTITLSWDPPESLGGRTDLTYVIEYQDLQKSTVDTLELNINTVIITGLVAGRQYALTLHPENGVSHLVGTRDNTVNITVLLGCPAGEYLSVANAECRVCPGNSEGTVSGLTVCPCVDGYYRAESEEDRECTRTSPDVADISYWYQDSEDSSFWAVRVNVTTLTITDLLPGREYTLTVKAEDGVSFVAGFSNDTVGTTVVLGSVPTQPTLCGGGPLTLTSESGSIETLNWPSSAYPLNTNCMWDIVCPSGNEININFDANFRIAGRMPACDRDRLYIFDCNEAITYGPFCHLTAPQPITSSCNAIKVRFESGNDRGSSRTGFRMHYMCVPPTNTSAPPSTLPPQCGGGLQVRDEGSGSIETLGYDQDPYPINTNCLWQIQCQASQKVHITFSESFKIAGAMPDCAKDQLEIFDCDGNVMYGPFCHLTAPQPIMSQCAAVDVQFHAGDERGVKRTGFRLNYECV